MDHYPFQCSRAFANENARFGGCAIFPFLAAASESGGDLVFSNGCDGSGATKLFEPRCEQGGEPYRVASYIIELRRQATQLIKYEHIQGRAIDHVPIERNPNQAETDLMPVCEQTLRGQEPARELMDSFIGAEHHDRLSIL